jgi:hypothetical protein
MFQMNRAEGKGPGLRGWKRGFLVGATVVGTLLALAGQAAAQSPCGVSAIDQYVECVPTGDGRNSSGANQGAQPPSAPLPPPIVAQIESSAGDDADVLRQVAASPRYGAPSKSASRGGASTHGRISGEELGAAGPDSDATAGGAVSAAVSAVQGGDAARFVGLLVALFLITAVALALAAVRQKRRAAA